MVRGATALLHQHVWTSYVVTGTTTGRPLTRADVLRAQDVADLTGIPVSTVHEWARTDRIPSRKRGRHRLFLRAEVESWLLAQDD